jgi:TolB protein
MSNQDGPDEIHTMNSNGSKQTRLTFSGAPSDNSPVFSPSGHKIALHTNRVGNFEVYEMRTDGTGPVNLTDDPAGDFTPDWQPLREQN